MQDETSTFDDDVDALLAEQERLEVSQKKQLPLTAANSAVEAYKLKQVEKKVVPLKTDKPKGVAVLDSIVEKTAAQNTPPQKQEVPKKKSSFGRKMLFVIVPFVGLAFLGFYLPKIIVAAGYAPEIINSLLKPYGVTATFDVVTLDWTKPIELKSVKLKRLTPFNAKNAGELEAPVNSNDTGAVDLLRLMELEAFQTGKTLWEIVQSPRNLGAISLNKPTGLLVLATNEKQQAVNNWSDIIETISKTESKTITPVDLHIQEGELEIKDMGKSQQMNISKLKMDLLNNLNEQKQVIAKTGNCQTEFNLVINNQARPFIAQAAWAEKAGKVSLKSEQFPLSLLQPYINQYQPGYQLTGNATSLVNMQWVTEPAFQLSQADIAVNAEQVAFTCTELTPRIVTIPKLSLKCAPRLIYQSANGNQQAPLEMPASQIPTSWDLTATLEKPMLITPVLNELQKPTQNYAAIWDDQEVNLVTNLEFQGLNAAANNQQSTSAPQSELLIREMRLNSQSVNLQATGKINDLNQVPVIDLQMAGMINSGKIFPVIDPTFAQQFQFEGLKLTTGRIQGPLWATTSSVPMSNNEPSKSVPIKENLSSIELAILDLPGERAELICQGDFQWQRANLTGMPFEQGVLNAYYQGDKLKLTPGGLKVMQGELRLEPTLQFVQNDILIHMPEGKILDHAILTREFSQQYLKYASPLFAEATAVNGEFSFAVPKTTYSLNQITQPNLNKDVYQGQLEFHQAKVGPGALFGEIAQLVETIRSLSGKQGVVGALQPGATWVEMPAQKVNLQMTQGRVYHDQMIFQISSLPLVSSGSVGVQDQTLDISMKMSLPDSDKKILKMLANQDIELKLTGTSKQPRLDKGTLANWGKNFGAGAAFNLIDSLIERRREKQGK